MASPKPHVGDDLDRWVSAVIEEVPYSDDEQPLSLSQRPLENWNRLVIGETNTLRGGRETLEILAAVRAAQQPRPSSRRRWLVAAVTLLVLCAAVAWLVWRRSH